MRQLSYSLPVSHTSDTPCDIGLSLFCKEKRHHDLSWCLFNEMRQLPTLPVSHPTGTLGSIGLNFCVRNVNRCDPYDMTTAMAPRTGLEPVTIRLTAERSTYWATEDHAFLLTPIDAQVLADFIQLMNVLRPSSRRTKATAHNFNSHTGLIL